MVLQVDSSRQISTQKIVLENNFISSETGHSSVDTIRFGKKEQSAFSRFTGKVTGFFSWIYVKTRFLLSKIFFCFDFFKIKESKLEKYQRNLKELNSYARSFAERKKRINYSGDLRPWWIKTFKALDSEIRRMFLLEDVKTYAGDDCPDKDAWAEKNFSKHYDTSLEFVGELKEIVIAGQRFDPLEFMPIYFTKVKEKLEQKIKQLAP